MNNLSDTFWAYLAGYIDADGTITICQNGPRVTVCNTHLPTLEFIHTTLGMGYIQELTGKSLKARRTKPCYNLNFGSRASEVILSYLIPYLREKQERATDLMAYFKLCINDKDQERIVLRQEAAKAFRMKWSPNNNGTIY